jgi:hypothetical protein
MNLRDFFTTDYSSRKLRHVSLLVVVLITAAVYSPSLFHAARSDQIVYLADVAGKDSFLSIVFESYALDRTREFYLGEDHLLFRPVLHSLLGLEKWLFGYGFFWWQMASLLLHLCVVWLLLKILYREGQHIFAPLFALFFAVQFTAMDMVIWHHLAGYLLFSVFLLSAIYNLRRYGEENTPSRGLLLVAFLLLAAFTYELGNAAALFVALYMTFSNLLSRRDMPRYGRGVIAASFAVPAAYTVLSVIDLYARFGNLSYFEKVSSSGLPGVAVKALGAMLFWLVAGLNPPLIGITVYERLSMSIGDILSPWALIGSVIAGIFLSSVIFICRETFTWEQFRKNAGFVVLLLLVMFAHAVIIIVGRADGRGFWLTISINTYYSYLSNLLAVIAIYIALNVTGPKRPFGVVPRAGLVASLALITVMSITSISSVNMEMLDYTRPRGRFVEKLEDLVQKHSGDEEFSFSVSENCLGIDIQKVSKQVDEEGFALSTDRQGNDILWIKRSGDTPAKTYTVAEALYPRYHVESGGKYEVSCTAR